MVRGTMMKLTTTIIMAAINDNILPFSSGTGWVPLKMVLLLGFVVGTQGFTSNIIETTATTAPSSLPPRHRHHHRHRHRHPFFHVKTTSSPSSSLSLFRLYDSSSIQSTTNAISATTSETEAAEVDAGIHPAVAGWPEKYTGSNKSGGGTFHVGPRKISDSFDVVSVPVTRETTTTSSNRSTERLFEELDVENWPTWTTSDKPKWQVGNVVRDKVMPYNELSYVISGKLRITYSNNNNSNISSSSSSSRRRSDDGSSITPTTTGTEVVVIGPGEFVTFPKDFCATWEVLEELTWYYYLY